MSLYPGTIGVLHFVIYPGFGSDLVVVTVTNHASRPKSGIAILIDLVERRSRVLAAVDDVSSINLDIDTHITRNDHFVYAARITTNDRGITKCEHMIKCVDLRKDQKIPIDVCPAFTTTAPQDPLDPHPKKKLSKERTDVIYANRHGYVSDVHALMAQRDLVAAVKGSGILLSSKRNNANGLRVAIQP